ncbi:hypothetical protein GIB67_016055 [Kingdonia uniflora]|uniref:Uncharacterized protein n=1 Tax=Kingdonia uniflora TaxID=39325 RepID=A0A7J7L1Y9_9MAGN|nr:hypothetical protein GIB67_016055 [Kingdonia uniflora]
MYHGLDTAVMTGGAITGFVQLLTYWFYEYCGVGHPIVKEDVKYHIEHRTVDRITWEPWLDYAISEIGYVLTKKLLSRKERETYASYWGEQTSEVGHLLTDSQRMGNIDLFGPTTLKTGITPVVVTSMSLHSLSQDFSLPDDVEGPDPGWHIEWTGRCEMLLIARLRDPPPMSSSCGAEEL